MGSWSNGASKENMVPPTTPTTGASPDRLRGATQDLFELLERVQCSRLDDQRCVLPPYFSQVSPFFQFFLKHLKLKTKKVMQIFTNVNFFNIHFNFDTIT